MNPPNKPKSLQDILKQRQKSGFVGREEQVNLFRKNLELPLEDSRRHFLFNVWGQGGVGKSTLWAIARRGRTYRSMKCYQEALQDFDRAIELDPKYYWAIASRGETYLLMKHYQEAIQDFNLAINLDVEDDWCLYTCGLAYKALQQKDKALADLALAIKLAKKSYETNPKNWRNIFNLALYYLAVEYPKPAEDLYCYALSLDASLESKREAIQDLNDFLTIFPNHVQAQSMRQLLQSSLKT
ncbi:tetratricopeptide repeat protein [Halotia wernerae UHCC 0503]|nr:tetratricopeptide repeat protein [Halotia wernerae UHCC 0503]